MVMGTKSWPPWHWHVIRSWIPRKVEGHWVWLKKIECRWDTITYLNASRVVRKYRTHNKLRNVVLGEKVWDGKTI